MCHTSIHFVCLLFEVANFSVVRFTCIADQFSLRGDRGFTGDAFAAALASSASADLTEETADSAPWPKWATELRRPRGGSIEDAPANEVVLLELRGPDAVILRVTNVHRSWERFHATVLASDTGDDESAFVVTPLCGDLAPRGGANNVCDESKPYHDFADLAITRRGAGTALAGAEAILLVRTEEEQWIWRLVCVDN